MGEQRSDPPIRVRPWGVVRLAVIVALLAVGIVLWVSRGEGGDATPQQTALGRHPHLPASPPAPAPTGAQPHHTPAPHQIAVRGLTAPLSPGACMYFPPTNGNRHETVFLDPGHGGLDPGAEGHTSTGRVVFERQATLPVAKDAAGVLRARGYGVVLSRTRNENVVVLPSSDRDGKLMTPDGVHLDVVARVACANAAHANVLVSIHFNTFGTPDVGGADTHYDSSRPFGRQNHRLAQIMQGDLVRAFAHAGWPVPNRGLINWTQENAPALTARANEYGHLLMIGPYSKGWNDHPSQMPGVLIEPLFVSRPTEADIAVSSHGQHVMGAAIAHAIQQFLNP
ncbi:MAG TPA: N-acetylmuramoyl-L-alanine amidase [Nocardioidaceae bacterium]|nr:N-acetylmuramoyl-L-alanine amidase [Nocardioidaceae bacterium]